jgi:hypothetical protein
MSRARFQRLMAGDISADALAASERNERIALRTLRVLVTRSVIPDRLVSRR